MKVKISFSLILFVFLLFSANNKNFLVLAQEQETQENPLNIETNSDLIPRINRELSDFERRIVQDKITELDQQAQLKWKIGNQEEAFDLWYEAIRLSKYINIELELKTITKVASVAWENNRNQDLNFLTERLLFLESEQSKDDSRMNPNLLNLFADAYQTLHNIDKSISTNQQILRLARQENDIGKIQNTLDKLGKFYLGKFDYYQALPIYQELLSLAQNNENYLQEGIYLRQLAEINGAIVQPENAIKYKNLLADNYLHNQDLLPIPALKISIADDYKTMDKPEEASQLYQEAFALAWSLEQYATAGDALKKLGKLYQQYEQSDYALEIYQQLIKIEQQSYNLYGLMNTYEQIGLIYQQKQEYSQARQAFEKALEISHHIKYKEDYFLGKINQLESE